MDSKHQYLKMRPWEPRLKWSKNGNNTGRDNINWAEVQFGGRGLSYRASQVLALVISTTGWGMGGRARHSGTCP